MAKSSAGLLMYRFVGKSCEVFLVHPGGPFFAGKDSGSWTIPKGEPDSDEDGLRTAIREFEEETGVEPKGKMIELGSVKQKGGKVVSAWAFKGDCDPQKIKSNTFTIEWPPKSGKKQEFPEIDRAAWLSLEDAREKINPAQAEFIERLTSELGV